MKSTIINSIKKVILILFAQVIILNAFSQRTFTKLDSLQGVIFYYKWKPSKLFKKDSPYMLMLKIENTNNYSAQVSFVVDFFWDGFRSASSEKLNYCVFDDGIIRGKLRGLGFGNSEYTNEQLESDRFTLELSDIEVERTGECKTSILLRSQ